METFLKRSFHEPGLSSRELLTEPVLTFLNQYDWPGNVLELKNVCTYFSCIYHREPLSLSDLPGYILNQIRKHEQQLDITEHRILSLIAANPRSGRSFLCSRLKEEGIQLSEANIRTSLQRLASAGYIKVHRTRGGCEITELGAGEHAVNQTYISEPSVLDDSVSCGTDPSVSDVPGSMTGSG